MLFIKNLQGTAKNFHSEYQCVAHIILKTENRGR